MRSYLCAMCGATVTSKRRRDLTDAELRRFTENGSAAGLLWSDGGLGL